MTTKFATYYNHPKSRGLKFNSELGVTQQHFKDECDVNRIVAASVRSGTPIMPNPARMKSFGDFTLIQDFQSAQNQILEAQEMFMSLPATTRDRFDNDPAKLITFLSDDKNRSEAEKLGFIDIKSKPTPPVPPPDPKPDAQTPSPTPSGGRRKTDRP